MKALKLSMYTCVHVLYSRCTNISNQTISYSTASISMYNFSTRDNFTLLHMIDYLFLGKGTIRCKIYQQIARNMFYKKMQILVTVFSLP